MKLLDILKNKEALFSIDEVEDKKTKVLVKDINTALINLVTEYEDFLEFAASQLNGEYHQKLVNLKSLKDHYEEWNGTKQAYIAAQREEENRINKLYANKSSLIGKLKSLESDCQKSLPVVATYHLSNGELVNSREEHETVILGHHNINIIEDIINELERDIMVEGNFDKVYPTELNANYSIVENNVNLCNKRISELFENKPGKAEKLSSIVNSMITAAENLVFFETYKTTMIDVGCPNKDVDLLQKELLKKYVPLKKQLQKALKISFEDISDIVVDENEYPNDEDSLPGDNFENADESVSFGESTPEENNDVFLDSYSFGNEDQPNEDTPIEDNPFVGDIPPAEEPPVSEDPFTGDIPPAGEPLTSEDDVFADMDDLMGDFTEEVIPTNDIPEEAPVDIDDLSHVAPPKKSAKKSKKTQSSEEIIPPVEETSPVSNDEPQGDDISPIDIDTPLDTDE